MLITYQKALSEFCASLKSAEFITFDTEFLREKTYYPKLCLIQISGPDKNAAAIDPLGDLDLEPILDLLFDPKILKIIHAGRQDLEIIYKLSGGQIVKPLFDTQIAAMVCGYGESAGYESLVRQITGGAIDKTSQFTNWALRPLSERQLTYALADVTFLVDVYLHLRTELERQGRLSWVEEEEAILADPRTYDPPADEAWRRIKIRSARSKNLAVLKDLAAWREKRAQARNIPRPWVLRDETLAELATQLPRDVSALKKTRGLTPDQADGDLGRVLLDVIAQALKSNPQGWPPAPKPRSAPSAEIMATAEILRMLLKVQCAEAGVAPKLVADSDDLEALAAQENPDIAALKGWRFDIFGRDALELKSGRLAIGIKNGKVIKHFIA